MRTPPLNRPRTVHRPPPLPRTSSSTNPSSLTTARAPSRLDSLDKIIRNASFLPCASEGNVGTYAPTCGRSIHASAGASVLPQQPNAQAHARHAQAPLAKTKGLTAMVLPPLVGHSPHQRRTSKTSARHGRRSRRRPLHRPKGTGTAGTAKGASANATQDGLLHECHSTVPRL